MNKNPYLYDDVPVFINKLGIKDASQLEDSEYTITKLRAAEIFHFPIEGKYDLRHLQSVHSALFSDLYEWAGRARESVVHKMSPSRTYQTTFALPDEIEALLARVAASLKDRNYLRNLDKAPFTDGLLEAHISINFCHPFPEGNGRTTQVLMRQLAWDAGYYLDFSGINKNEWATSNALSVPHSRLYEKGAVKIPETPDRSSLAVLFSRIVRPREDVEPRPSSHWFIK